MSSSARGAHAVERGQMQIGQVRQREIGVRDDAHVALVRIDRAALRSPSRLVYDARAAPPTNPKLLVDRRHACSSAGGQPGPPVGPHSGRAHRTPVASRRHPRCGATASTRCRRTTTLLVLRGDCLYDARVIRGLAKARQALLEVDVDGRSHRRWPPTCARIRLAAVGALVARRVARRSPARTSPR